MTKRTFISLILWFLLVVITIISLLFFAAPNPNLLNILIAFIPPLLLKILIEILKPFFNQMQESSSKTIKNEEVCRIILFGRGGSGKTTLIKSILGGSPNPETPTPDFIPYPPHDKYIDDLKKKVKIQIADYQGQRPSDILQFSPEEWKSEGKLVANIIFFIVDISSCRDKNNNPLNYEEAINWLASDTNNKIEARVDEHREYINETSLHLLFNIVFDKQALQSVRLLINKIDLAEELIDRGYISKSAISDTTINNEIITENYVNNLFKKIANNIKKACEQNDINFSVNFISAYKDINTRTMLDDVLKKYTNRQRKITTTNKLG